MNYVVGYMLNPATEEVLMLRKNRPAFQNGKWNGIGGKMDKPGETPQQAQAREFFEEAGVETSPDSWEHVATVRGCNDEARPGEDYLIYVFRNMVHEFPAFRSVTSEPVKLWTLADIFRLPCHSYHRG
jgi:8-oxo-dGTP pyrophosphatase MutT (NUDIX family)